MVICLQSKNIINFKLTYLSFQEKLYNLKKYICKHFIKKKKKQIYIQFDKRKSKLFLKKIKKNT